MNLKEITRHCKIDRLALSKAIKNGSLPEDPSPEDVLNATQECPWCHQRYFTEKHLTKCKGYADHKAKILTKEVLEHDYHVLMLSLPKIAEKYGVAIAAIDRTMIKFGIPKRTMTEAHLISLDERAQTNLANSGFAHNFCKQHPSRLSWENRLLEEEGIINVFQRESVKEKSQQTMMRKYGVTHCMHIAEIRRKCFSESRFFSMPHRKICKILTENCITFEIEYGIKRIDVNRVYSYDIYIPKANLLIEVNGDFYHAHPAKYLATDLIALISGPKTAQEIWDRDLKKKNLALSLGYNFLYLWERDINSDILLIEEELISKIKELSYDDSIKDHEDHQD